MAIAGRPTGVEYALAYAARGWAVAPAHGVTPAGGCTCGRATCESPGKHPRTQHGLKDATTDEQIIRAWWRRMPDSNLLVRTGNGLVVLDVDPRHMGDESVGRLEARYGVLPSTPIALTGGGGSHIFFRSAEPVPCSANKLGEGLDVRGEGGYVIVPPSCHVSGREYRWDSGAHPTDVPLAELPAWLASLAGKVRTATSGPGGDASAYIEGGRNNALTSMAGAMRDRGFEHPAIEAALLVQNETRCKPPLDPREVQRIATSVSRYAPKNAPIAGDPWGLVSVHELATPLPPVPWLSEPLALSPGAVTLVGGYGFSGKTVALQALALAVATGRPVWGLWSCRRGPVVHLDYEQGRRLTQERYQRLAWGLGIDLASLPVGSLRVACLPRLYLDDASAEAALEELAAGCALLIDDSFRASFPSADENDSKVRRHLDMLTRVSERTGCTIIVILHARKPSQGEPMAARFSLRGSSAIFDAAQSIFIFHGSKDEPTRVDHEKCRVRGTTLPQFGLRVEDVDERKGLRVVHLDRAEMGGGGVGGGSAAASNGLAEAIVQVLAAHPEGMSKRALRSALRELRTAGNEQVDNAIESLLLSGVVECRIPPVRGLPHVLAISGNPQ